MHRQEKPENEEASTVELKGREGSSAPVDHQQLATEHEHQHYGLPTNQQDDHFAYPQQYHVDMPEHPPTYPY
jgi:hypothetical protein